MFGQIANVLGRLGRFLRIPAGVQLRVSHSNQVKASADIESSTIYVTTSHGHAKWAQFRCPCGCGEIVLLNLSPSRRPRWTISNGLFGQATVSPSVWRTEGCGSHFFIRRGRIEWCSGNSVGNLVAARTPNTTTRHA